MWALDVIKTFRSSVDSLSAFSSILRLSIIYISQRFGLRTVSYVLLVVLKKLRQAVTLLQCSDCYIFMKLRQLLLLKTLNLPSLLVT